MPIPRQPNTKRVIANLIRKIDGDDWFQRAIRTRVKDVANKKFRCEDLGHEDVDADEDGIRRTYTRLNPDLYVRMDNFIHDLQDLRKIVTPNTWHAVEAFVDSQPDRQVAERDLFLRVQRLLIDKYSEWKGADLERTYEHMRHECAADDEYHRNPDAFYGVYQSDFMASVRSRTIRLAAAKPELRPVLLPLLKEDADPAKPTKVAADPDARKMNDLFQSWEDYVSWVYDDNRKSRQRTRGWKLVDQLRAEYAAGKPYNAILAAWKKYKQSIAEDHDRAMQPDGEDGLGWDLFASKTARRREDPNRVVLMVTTSILGPMVVNVTNGINKKYTYDGTPEGLAATMQQAASVSLRFQSMDFLDGPEINVIKAPRVPSNIAQMLSNPTVVRGPVYVALRGTSYGLEWVILPRAPKFATTDRRA